MASTIDGAEEDSQVQASGSGDLFDDISDPYDPDAPATGQPAAWTSVLAGNTYLSMGSSTGELTTYVVRVLGEQGYAAGEDEPGVFDVGTDQAVRAYQGDHQLVADGIVGPITANHLAPGESVVTPPGEPGSSPELGEPDPGECLDLTALADVMAAKNADGILNELRGLWNSGYAADLPMGWRDHVVGCGDSQFTGDLLVDLKRVLPVDRLGEASVWLEGALTIAQTIPMLGDDARVQEWLSGLPAEKLLQLNDEAAAVAVSIALQFNTGGDTAYACHRMLADR